MDAQIRHRQNILCHDHAVADGDIPGALLKLQARLLGDMQPVLVQNVNRRARHVEHALRQLGDCPQFVSFGILEGDNRPHGHKTLHLPIRSRNRLSHARSFYFTAPQTLLPCACDWIPSRLFKHFIKQKVASDATCDFLPVHSSGLV